MPDDVASLMQAMDGSWISCEDSRKQVLHQQMTMQGR